MTDKPKSADELVEEHFKLRDHVAAQTKAFQEYLKPAQSRLEEIENQLLAMLNTQGCDSFKTEHGTAYKSTLMNTKIDPDAAVYVNGMRQEVRGREALLDFALDHWDEIGNEMLMLNAQKDSVKRWMDDHAGTPPPGISVGWFTRVNIRRS